ALADAGGVGVGALGELEQRLEAADLLVVATASARPVVTAPALARATGRRIDREVVGLAIAVPGTVDPEARTTPSLQLFDLDDLQRLCCPAGATASAALVEAERVV